MNSTGKLEPSGQAADDVSIALAVQLNLPRFSLDQLRLIATFDRAQFFRAAARYHYAGHNHKRTPKPDLATNPGDANVAKSSGVNLFGYKLRAFFIAAALAGIAGALRAHSQREIGTELGYGLDESIILLGMIVIGGLGSNLGPFFGAATVILLEDLANVVGSELALLFPDQAARLLTSFRPIFFGLVLMLFLIFEPRGLAHRWQLIKASWRLRPFSR